MDKRYRLFAVAAVLVLSPLAAFAAPLVVDKATYSLTYPDGWSNSLIPTPDTTLSMVMNMGNGAVTWTQGLAAPGLDAGVYMAAMSQVHANGYSRTDSSVKQLGGRAFITTGWRDTSADGDSATRLRFYAFSQGNFLFFSWVIYDTPEADAAVADVEAALASLNIKVPSSLRRAFRAGQLSPETKRLDALGRIRTSSVRRVPTTPYFPSR